MYGWNENSRLGLCNGGCGNNYEELSTEVYPDGDKPLELAANSAIAAYLDVPMDETGAVIGLTATSNGPSCGGGDCGGGEITDIEIDYIEGDGRLDTKRWDLTYMTEAQAKAVQDYVDSIDPEVFL